MNTTTPSNELDEMELAEGFVELAHLAAFPETGSRTISGHRLSFTAATSLEKCLFVQHIDELLPIVQPHAARLRELDRILTRANAILSEKTLEAFQAAQRLHNEQVCSLLSRGVETDLDFDLRDRIEISRSAQQERKKIKAAMSEPVAEMANLLAPLFRACVEILEAEAKDAANFWTAYLSAFRVLSWSQDQGHRISNPVSSYLQERATGARQSLRRLVTYEQDGTVWDSNTPSQLLAGKGLGFLLADGGEQ